MAFTTLAFVVFFATVFMAYYLLPRRWQWGVLFVASWVFYSWHSWVFPLFLLVTVLATYGGARAIGLSLARQREWLKGAGKALSRDEKRAYKLGRDILRRWVLAAVLTVLLGMLGIFKYLPWVAGMWGMSISLILPIGLSFYVFQSIAYCIDVYREEVEPEKNILRHALYVSYFPQIMQGPIGNYGRLAHQLFDVHEFDYGRVVIGLQRIAWGFFKKLVCANQIATLIDPVWAVPERSPGLLVWGLYLALYAVQLYADFSGYMDIACGCSQMLGITLDENFNCPYFSKSVPEFWRRWHMSLSSWFKDYLFYPILRAEWCASVRSRLASNKYLSTVIPTGVALSVVWLATGLWHGASWGYVAWGAYYGLFMIGAVVVHPLDDCLAAKYPCLLSSRPYQAWQMIRTFAIVLLGYAFFRPADLGITARIFSEMISGLGYRTYILFVHIHWQGLAVALLSALLIFGVDAVHYLHGESSLRKLYRRLPWPIRWGGYGALLYVIIVWGTYGDPNLANFAYFQF